MKAFPTRRRFLGIAASVGGMALLPPWTARAGGSDLHIWRGVALGADACLQIHHPDPAEADRLIRLCLDEVERLERVFSLYRPNSALVRLNRTGELADPPLDMVRLLTEAARFSRLTDGAFDVTVQPLWQLYAEHFARPGADPEGPPKPRSKRCVPWSITGLCASMSTGSRSPGAGMAATLNGIAQGYITDRVADRLRSEGMTSVLVDMGEVFGMGRHPDEGRRGRVEQYVVDINRRLRIAWPARPAAGTTIPPCLRRPAARSAAGAGRCRRTCSSPRRRVNFAASKCSSSACANSRSCPARPAAGRS